MIFQILEIRKMANEARENPSKFASGQAGGLFLDILIVPAIISFLVLAVFFVFGFTSLLGGPYLFFKVLFFLAFLFVLCAFYFLRKIYRLIKSVTSNTVERIKVKSKSI